MPIIFIILTILFLNNLLAISTKEGLLQTKKIEIPNYKRAYNPSIIAYKDGYLMTFRYATTIPNEYKESRTEASFIGICRLDLDFNIDANTVELLKLITHRDTYSITAEDARIFSFQNRLFIIFNDKPKGGLTKGCQMYLAELFDTGSEIVAKQPALVLQSQNLSPLEKNWSPFVFQDNCFVIYSDNPRVIFKMDVDSGSCQEISRSEQTIPWNYGQIRGGSQAIQINNQFLTFFHSSTLTKRNKRHYYMGAYTFEASYPFAISAISLEEIKLQENENDNEGKFVVFPGGILVNEKKRMLFGGKMIKKSFFLPLIQKNF